MSTDRFPALDAHAHIATDVTASQVSSLAGSVVIAVTRSIAEASEASLRRATGLVWGCGVHPGDRGAMAAYDGEEFRRLLGSFAVVGEVGLDRQGAPDDKQVAVLEDVIAATVGEPVFLSLHASGREQVVVDILARGKQSNAVLHWFLGSEMRSRDALPRLGRLRRTGERSADCEPSPDDMAALEGPGNASIDNGWREVADGARAVPIAPGWQRTRATIGTSSGLGSIQPKHGRHGFGCT